MNHTQGALLYDHAFLFQHYHVKSCTNTLLTSYANVP